MTVARWVDRVYPLLTAVRDGADEINHLTSLQPANTMEGVVPLRAADLSNAAGELADVEASSLSSQLTALLQDMNMSMATLQQLADNLHECVIHPGEILYFPSMWMHATLNLDSYNVFMSLFMDPQLMKD
jgi:mannose-6-phosphate isomerase class I